MTTTYLAIAGQVAGNPADWSMAYTAVGEPGPDRQRVIDWAIEELGHDDFCVGTLRDGRLAAYGFGLDDFAPEDRDSLDEIGRQLAIDVVEGAR